MQPADRLARRRQPLRSSAVRDLLADAHRPGMISLAGGLPAADLFDSQVFSTLAADLLAHSPQEALQYGMTAGQPRLQAAVRVLVKDRGIDALPSDPLITTGSQQAIDLLARAFIEPGDTVVMERPSYLAALQVFSLVDADVLGVPTDEHGMCLPLPAGPALGRAKLVYTVTNFANPSGVTMSRERRLALLRWAVANRVFVIEDDPYGELRFSGRPVPALVTLAAEVPGASDWCGYVSTLSKILAPGLRVGFALLPDWVRARVEQIKQAMDLHTSTLCQELAARYPRNRPADGLSGAGAGAVPRALRGAVGVLAGGTGFAGSIQSSGGRLVFVGRARAGHRHLAAAGAGARTGRDFRTRLGLFRRQRTAQCAAPELFERRSDAVARGGAQAACRP
jgi:2-aminoadipate transaminase